MTIIAIQRTQRLPQWVGQLARVPQVFLSKVPKICPKFASHEILLDFRRLRAPSYFVSSETEEVGGPFTLSIATFRLYCDIDVKLYTIEQCVTVPKMFNDTDTGTFFGTKFFRYRFRDFFPTPNFTDTGSETFFGTKFFRYRFRYHLKKLKIPGTGSGTH